MEFLPDEVLEEILMNTVLSVKDVLKFKSTCTRFYNLLSDNKFFWRKKYVSLWSQCVGLFDNNFNQWYEELCYAFKITEHEKLLLTNMSLRFYNKLLLSDYDLEEWTTFLIESPRSYEYLIVDLMKILCDTTVIRTIEVVPLCTPGNLTLKHYAAKVLIFIRHWYLRRKWYMLLSSNSIFQTLEEVAIFVAEWFQPTKDIKRELIIKQLDDLANQVKCELKNINPSHRLHKVPQETLLNWKCLDVEENLWNKPESWQIISCAVNVLQNMHHFQENYNGTLSNNYFINKVLDNHTGVQIMICIIYQSVARRLGVKCIPVGFQNYFLLKVFNSSDDYYYVDIFKNGAFVSKNRCVFQNNHQVENIPDSHKIPFTFTEFKTRIADILYNHYHQSRHSDDIRKIHTALEFRHLMKPTDDILNNFAFLYVDHSENLIPLQDHLLNDAIVEYYQPCLVSTVTPYNDICNNELTNTLSEESPKQHPADLKYAVGMVMRHRWMNYICVIYDWDPRCVKDLLEKEGDLYKLKRKNRQPFYKVLADYDLHYYIAEDDLTPAQNPRMLISNADVGRHFSHFYITHYVPNEEKEKEYPTDYEIRWNFHYAHHNNV